ncbi:ZinT family metal-binding protein [Rhizobium bangladeshense]|uniref:Metal-binding protein ZinT n=1 Tax=Rhizobium bangladeshense TaxID=1138189 RepID=A0ABS7LLD3_9HYPH|nr:metal-binding protein ZinT [Rhizobium bangladeshense]MBX4867678.1 metal-binding protein ZinT [Rhizobium bangladeshense]MBX4871971.1 metal-binding protein ZinT [Rhizobium bangladeshense]MBX4883284.1 metal-binding protein ZinT [Rhizobium bangladeshense]MBX4897803.1 metal-binding protein ZinT [Rhizobium bangladeshense]MBX4901285.1 metal-binding protein ZinT [Rhizobium bangladeshense]
MTKAITTLSYALAVSATLTFAGTAGAQTSSGSNHSHSHSHDNKGSVYDGYFDDDQVKARELSDWEGDWQSVYPYLLDGTLDPVMVDKAKHGDKSAGEYRAYYDTGYKTDVDRIVINGKKVTFFQGKDSATGDYETDGHEILTYKKGNRGVRFIFRKIAGHDAAPRFIQFSDHIVAPEKADHYHLYWGNDRAALLNEVTNWPTYYPARLTGKQIAEEMLSH